jgi:hypothetical protein
MRCDDGERLLSCSACGFLLTFILSRVELGDKGWFKGEVIDIVDEKNENYAE